MKTASGPGGTDESTDFTVTTDKRGAASILGVGGDGGGLEAGGDEGVLADFCEVVEVKFLSLHC